MICTALDDIGRGVLGRMCHNVFHWSKAWRELDWEGFAARQSLAMHNTQGGGEWSIVVGSEGEDYWPAFQRAKKLAESAKDKGLQNANSQL